MQQTDRKQQVSELAHLPAVEIADLLDMNRRQVYYFLDQLGKDKQVVPPTPEQKKIAEDFWSRGYTINSIAFRLSVMPSMPFSWHKRGLVTFGPRKRPKSGFRKHWCRYPEHRLADPGLYQCQYCPQGKCDERRERATWMDDKEFMEGRMEIGNGHYITI